MKVFENPSWRRLISNELLAEAPDDILLVDLDQVQTCQWPYKKCIVVTDKAEPSFLLEIHRSLGVLHAVQVSNHKLTSSIRLAGKMLSTPELFFDAPENLIFDGEHKSFRFNFRLSREKKTAITCVQNELAKENFRGTVIESVLAIVDELYTNVLFNAPVATDGSYKYRHLSRSKVIELDPDHFGRFVLVWNNQTLFVGCEDSYGSMVTSDVINRVYSCYARGTSEVMNKGDGGSGIGIYLAMEQATSLILAVKSQRHTLIGNLIQYQLPGKLLSSMPKNLHVIPSHPTTGN